MSRAEFSAKTKLAAWERSGGNCENCTAKLFPGNINYDHIIACALGGTNDLDNCAVLCRPCHSHKTARRDSGAIAKGRRRRARHLGIRGASRFRGWRKFNGEPVKNPAR